MKMMRNQRNRIIKVNDHKKKIKLFNICNWSDGEQKNYWEMFRFYWF